MSAETKKSPLFTLGRRYGEPDTPYFEHNARVGGPQLWVSSDHMGTYPTYLSSEHTTASHEQPAPLEIPIPNSLLKLCQAIAQAGGRALIVGGAVRDALIQHHRQDLKVSPKDLDVEVFGLEAQTLLRLLMLNYGEAAINLVGKSYGIIKLKLDGIAEDIDISIPRTDSKSGVGHGGFDVTGRPDMSIHQAGTRRDLRINAMSYDPLTKVIYDPSGGRFDLETRVARVTDPTTFIEDPLRALRLMQFIGRFDMRADQEAIEVCRKIVASGEMDTLPKDRVTTELTKLLVKSERPSLGLAFAREIGYIERYWPELAALIDVPQNPVWHPEGDAWTHTLQTVDAAAVIARREQLDEEETLCLTLILLCHDLAKATCTILQDGVWKSPGHEAAGVVPSTSFLGRFTFSKNIVAKVLAVVPEHMHPQKLWRLQFPLDDKPPIDTARAMRRLAGRLGEGNANMHQLSLTAEADLRGRNGVSSDVLERDQVPYLDEWQTWFMDTARELNIETQPAKQLLQGADLLFALQLTKGGRGIGIVLKLVYQDQLDGEIMTKEEALIKAVDYMTAWANYLGMAVNDPHLLNHPSWNQLGKLEDPREKVREIVTTITLH